MAYRLRRRRGARSWVSGSLRRYLRGILFVALAAIIIGLFGYLSTILPENTLTIGGNSTTTVTISSKVFVDFISFAVGIVLLITGVRYFIRRF